jgi:hypothetical protein
MGYGIILGKRVHLNRRPGARHLCRFTHQYSEPLEKDQRALEFFHIEAAQMPRSWPTGPNALRKGKACQNLLHL